MQWSFYNLETGAFTGRYFKARGKDDVERNTPEGCGAIEGFHDDQSSRVDLETGAVVDWQSPQPTPDHEWDDLKRRWSLSASELKRRAALAGIRRIERDEQPRAQREAILGKGVDRLQQIDDRIAELRAVISKAGRPDQRTE